MGWVWKDDDDSNYSSSGDVSDSGGTNSNSGNRCATRKVVKSECRTNKTEDGRFIRKCEKTEQIFRDCIGRPSELLQSNKEYTEEDVTDQMTKGSFTLGSAERGAFSFPGLQSDIEAIEHGFLGGLNRFFEAAEEMKNGFFTVFGTPHVYDDDSSSTAKRRGIPLDSYPPKEVPSKPGKSDGEVDLSGLARDV